MESGQMTPLIAPVMVALGTLLGLYLSVTKIKSGFKKELEEETQKAIHFAKFEAQKDVAILKGHIENITKEINRLEDSFQKDISYIKESYAKEVKNLSEKIETLRVEVSSQHGDLVRLLTKLIDER